MRNWQTANLASDRDLSHVQNTTSMWMCPDARSEFAELDDPGDADVTLRTAFSGEFFAKLVPYGVIVEGWGKVRKQGGSGRVRRAFEAAFTQAERNKLAGWHGRFYRWLVIEGTPARVACRLSTVDLLRRATDFFATI